MPDIVLSTHDCLAPVRRIYSVSYSYSCARLDELLTHLGLQLVNQENRWTTVLQEVHAEKFRHKNQIRIDL